MIKQTTTAVIPAKKMATVEANLKHTSLSEKRRAMIEKDNQRIGIIFFTIDMILEIISGIFSFLFH